MTTAAISSKSFQIPLVEEIRDFLDKIKKSKIFAIKGLCDNSFREKKDLKQHQVNQKKNSFFTNIWNSTFGKKQEEKTQTEIEMEEDTWDIIGNEIEKKVLSQLISLDPMDPFSGTDLLVFKDEYPGTLPLNGIRYSEFIEITKLLPNIFSGKTRFKLDATLSKESLKMLMRDFIILMTRKTSRELIKHLATGSHDIIFEDGEEYCLTKTINNGNLQYIKIFINNRDNLSSFFGNAAQHGRAKYKIPDSSFIAIAHELIHARHYQKNYLLTGELKEWKVEEYDDLEEKRTISGWALGEVSFNEDLSEDWDRQESNIGYDLYCEWAICSEFQLPLRENHHSGGELPPGAFSSNEYQDYLNECKDRGLTLEQEKVVQELSREKFDSDDFAEKNYPLLWLRNRYERVDLEKIKNYIRNSYIRKEEFLL
ncbi:MAG: hypothetical protein L0207_01445 [Chlamydiae bacterium]|nr:hypothetical protein [Chlamydiota bacterium]